MPETPTQTEAFHDHDHDHGGNGHGGVALLPADTPLPVLPARPARPWLQAHRILLLLLLAGLVIWLLSGFYEVGVGEVAIIERLGQFVNGPNNKPFIYNEGLHYHLPWPIDRVYIVPNRRTQTVQITAFHSSPAAYMSFERKYLRAGVPKSIISAVYSPYLITADQNVLHCKIALQYRIRNPVDYITAVYERPSQRNGEGRLAMIKQLAAHELIRKIAGTPVDAAIFYGRQQLEMALYDPGLPHKGAQASMTDLHMGIKVQKVQVEFIRWPREVNAAFLDVLRAQQQENISVQNASKYAQRVTTVAEGNAHAILNQAHAYSERVVQHAHGEISQFIHVYTQYKAHPRIVRLALFTRTVRHVLGRVTRVFYVQPHQSVSIVLQPPPQIIRARGPTVMGRPGAPGPPPQ